MSDLAIASANHVSISQAEIEAEFDTIWTHYPRRVGKGNALRKYLQARKKYSFEEITGPLRTFIWLQRGTEMTKIPHLATWLYQKRWMDDQTHAINRKATTDDQLDGLFPSGDLPALPNGVEPK